MICFGGKNIPVVSPVSAAKKDYGPEYKVYSDVPSLSLFYDEPLRRRELTIADVIDVSTTPAVLSDDDILKTLIQRLINIDIDELTVADYRYLVYKVLTAFPDPGLSFTWTSKYGGMQLQTKLDARAIRCVPLSLTDKDTGKVLEAGSREMREKANYYRSLGLTVPKMRSIKHLESLSESVVNLFGEIYTVIDLDSLEEIQEFLKEQPMSFLTEISNFAREVNPYGMEEVVTLTNSEYDPVVRFRHLAFDKLGSVLSEAEQKELDWLTSSIDKGKKPVAEPEEVVISSLITVANFFPGLRGN